MWVGMQSSGDFPSAVMWSEEWHWGRGSFEKCGENLKLSWKHLSSHSNCPELSQLQMKCSTYQAKLVLIYPRKRTSFATVQWQSLMLQQLVKLTWLNIASYEDKEKMHSKRAPSAAPGRNPSKQSLQHCCKWRHKKEAALQKMDQDLLGRTRSALSFAFLFVFISPLPLYLLPKKATSLQKTGWDLL